MWQQGYLSSYHTASENIPQPKELRPDQQGLLPPRSFDTVAVDIPRYSASCFDDNQVGDVELGFSNFSIKFFSFDSILDSLFSKVSKGFSMI
jgi:hypothetical protein